MVNIMYITVQCIYPYQEGAFQIDTPVGMRSIGPYAFRILLGYPPINLFIDSVNPPSEIQNIHYQGDQSHFCPKRGWFGYKGNPQEK